MRKYYHKYLVKESFHQEATNTRKIEKSTHKAITNQQIKPGNFRELTSWTWYRPTLTWCRSSPRYTSSVDWHPPGVDRHRRRNNPSIFALFCFLVVFAFLNHRSSILHKKERSSFYKAIHLYLLQTSPPSLVNRIPERLCLQHGLLLLAHLITIYFKSVWATRNSYQEPYNFGLKSWPYSSCSTVYCFLEQQ